MTKANFIKQTSEGFRFGVMDRDGNVVEDHGTVATFEEASQITGIKPRRPTPPPARCFTPAEMAAMRG